MRYYLLEEDAKYQNRPQIINIRKKIELRQLYERDYSCLPKRFLLSVKPNKKMDYVDVMTYPFLIVSKKIKHMLELYEPNLKYKEVVLLDKKFGTVGEYYLPVVKIMDCLGAATSFNLDHSEIFEVQISRSKLQDECIFGLTEGQNGIYVIRQDLAESIMRRDTYGYSLKEVKYEEEGEME